MTEPYELMLDCKDQGGNAVIQAPNICIVLLTYLRTEFAVRTIQGVCDNLDYPKELRTWYVADDGSPSEHIGAIFKTLEDNGESLYRYHNDKYRKGTPFCGIGWNRALEFAHMHSDYVLWLEDDWVLQESLDIRPWVRMLKEREDVGIVRMSGLATGNDVRIVAHNGVHYLQYLRKSKMAYSGNPLIRHVRFKNKYGLFDTKRSPGAMEISYDEAFRAQDGPDIWRPASINAWGVWGHIGRERTWK